MAETNYTTIQTVDLIAPADMPGGYQFSADVNGSHVLVQVPHNGVKEGQEFRADVVQVNNNGGGSHNIPVGSWRDGLFDCYKLGFCHQQMCTTLWLEPVALGQVLTRMKLDWSATPDVDTPAESLTGKRAAWSAFKIMLVMFVTYLIFDYFIYFLTQPLLSGHIDRETGVYYPPQNVPLWAVVFDQIRQSISVAYGIFLLIVIMRTRAHIRHLYSIPEKNCTKCAGCEDFCCALWCSSCTICQMARHTADYHQYKASCFTETGLDLSAPHVV